MQNGEIIDGVEDTLKRCKVASNKKGDEYGYYLYPYVGLKNVDDYISFISEVSGGEEIIVITRKPQSVPDRGIKSTSNIKFVFIDFTEKCEKECNHLTENELDYLYEKADKVITFDDEVYQKWVKKISSIYYIDMDQYMDQYYIADRFEDISDKFESKKLYNELERIIVF